jgi:hypothetical protein
MRKVKTISISLEPPYVEALETLAKESGSKSAAVRELLMDHMYREYYSDPQNVKEAEELTMELRSIASFPKEWHAKRRRGTRKTRPSR